MKVISRTHEVEALVLARVEAAVAKAAFDIEANAKVRAPVDTGALKNSIQASEETGNPTAWRVGDGVEYGIYQEFGTRFMPAHPWLVPAVEAVRSEFLEVIKSAVVE